MYIYVIKPIYLNLSRDTRNFECNYTYYMSVDIEKYLFINHARNKQNSFSGILMNNGFDSWNLSFRNYKSGKSRSHNKLFD